RRAVSRLGECEAPFLRQPIAGSQRSALVGVRICRDIASSYQTRNFRRRWRRARTTHEQRDYGEEYELRHQTLSCEKRLAEPPATALRERLTVDIFCSPSAEVH